MEDQPLTADASPTALSPGYVVDSDSEKDEKDKEEEEHTLLVYLQMILSPQAEN
nr:hypothetical protein [Tanacetum cinerariifolium]